MMKLFKFFSLISLIIAGVSAAPKDHSKGVNDVSSHEKSMKPSDWLTMKELESLPATAEAITWEKLEKMPVEEGQRLLSKIYHLSQINHSLKPSYVPSPSNMPVIFMKRNGQRIETNLRDMVTKAMEQPKFGNDEVTIMITGLPETCPAVAKANNKLVKAYMERYYDRKRLMNKIKDKEMEDEEDMDMNTSSEEEEHSESRMDERREISGDLVIIKLGSTLTDMKRYAQLDIEKTGEMLAKVLVDLTNEVDVPLEMIHLIGQGMGAHVAGVAGRHFKRMTGHRLRRITALDPARIYAKDTMTLTGLARGDADFIDAIHTNTRGLGYRARVGDVDFYVNGPAAIAPGSDNVIEAAMRATRYFTESVRPGMERNFPAVPANSMRQYKNKEGNGKRAYMGIDTEYDLKGDYMLEVNEKSPYGMSAPAEKQGSYHGLHQPWRSAAKIMNYN